VARRGAEIFFALRKKYSPNHLTKANKKTLLSGRGGAVYSVRALAEKCARRFLTTQRLRDIIKTQSVVNWKRVTTEQTKRDGNYSVAFCYYHKPALLSRLSTKIIKT